MSYKSPKDRNDILTEILSSQWESLFLNKKPTVKENSRIESEKEDFSWENLFVYQNLENVGRKTNECEEEDFFWEKQFLNKKSPDVEEENINGAEKEEFSWEKRFLALSFVDSGKFQAPPTNHTSAQYRSVVEHDRLEIISDKKGRDKQGTQPLFSPQIKSSFETLWSNILVETSSMPLVVLFTGARRGEGVSFVSYHFALYLSVEHSLKTVYVDLDVDSKSHPVLKDKLHKLPGISDFFFSSGYPIQKLIIETEYKNLFLLPYGHRDNNLKLSKILSSKNRFRDFIDYLRGNFDMVIIDSPSVIIHPEISILGREADNVILVCRYRFSQYEISQLAVERLIKAGVNKILAVLNDRYFPIPDAIYKVLK